MITLTKTELRWMLSMVKQDRENSRILKDVPGQQCAVLHNLNYENMTSLAEKLETVIHSDCKRIATRW